MARVGISSPAHLDLRPDPISTEDYAPMVLCLEDEDSERSDKDAINVGDPSVTVRRDIVIGGMFIAQSQRTKMISENPLALCSAPVGDVHSAVSGYDKTGGHQCNRAEHGKGHDASDCADGQKGGSETDRSDAHHKTLPGFFLQMIG